MVASPHRKKSVCCTRTICADASQASTLPLIRASTVLAIEVLMTFPLPWQHGNCHLGFLNRK